MGAVVLDLKSWIVGDAAMALSITSGSTVALALAAASDKVRCMSFDALASRCCISAEASAIETFLI